ncbi:MAG: cupin domain-containing protein [Calditrichota bacterium]
MEQLITNYEEMDWEEAEGYPIGSQIKILSEHNGARTFILNLPPGFAMDAHSHMYNEQHLVLDGSYIGENVTYRKGAYRYIPKHTNHGPYRSETGVTLLIIYDTMD